MTVTCPVCGRPGDCCRERDELRDRLKLNQAALTDHIREYPGWEDFDGTPESAVGAVQTILDAARADERQRVAEWLGTLTDRAYTPAEIIWRMGRDLGGDP